MKTETPKLGTGATYSVGSDRYAATVVAVSKSGHQVTLQDDKATMVNADGLGWYGQQEYTYEADPNGRTRIVTRRRTGEYRIAGYKSSGFVTFGTRRQYRDPSF